MVRRAFLCVLLVAAMLAGVGCKKRQATNPLANVQSKQPDKMLYDRALRLMQQKKYATARMALQTLIGAYPDSEYVAQAKLAVGDSWYDEGTPAALSQAETEYRDFITFFPNMPEAAEAQLKIANIHFRQMGKPDRDFTHALKAQDEYRLLLTQYPDSKFAKTARLRLLEVQEVLAERLFRIERFYFQRGALLAAIARGQTLVDTYPLYSKADEALYILGEAYQQQAARTEASALEPAAKKKLDKGYLEHAVADYTRIVTRYPAMPRFREACQRLAEMHRPVPQPTPQAIARNKKEQASRKSTTAYERFVLAMGKRPELSAATRVGQPIMTDPPQTDAPTLARAVADAESAALAASRGVSPKVEAKSVGAKAKGAATQQASSSSAAAVHPSDIPAQPPVQENEMADSSSSSSSSSAGKASDGPKSYSSNRKGKKKHHFHIHLPF